MRSAQSISARERAGSFYVTCLLPELGQCPSDAGGGCTSAAGGGGSVQKRLLLARAPAGPRRPCLPSPCTPALGGRGWPAVAEGRGAARLTWRPRGCGVPGEVSARAALRRVGVGRPGRRTAGVLVSANSLRGFPGSCSGGLLSRISPLISPYFPSPFLLSLPPPAKFKASAMRWVWLPSKL